MQQVDLHISLNSSHKSKALYVIQIRVNLLKLWQMLSPIHANNFQYRKHFTVKLLVTQFSAFLKNKRNQKRVSGCCLFMHLMRIAIRIKLRASVQATRIKTKQKWQHSPASTGIPIHTWLTHNPNGLHGHSWRLQQDVIMCLHFHCSSGCYVGQNGYQGKEGQLLELF